MLFKRKKRLSAVMRLRYAAWPARSFRRSFRYRLLRLLRINASAHSIALGCALGVFAVFTPFLGLQMTIAALLALALRGSVLASAVGSFAGNPLTYPIIWISTFTAGNVLLGQLGQRRDQHAFERSRSPRPLHPGGFSQWRRHGGSRPVADPQAHGAGLAAFGGLERACHLFSRPPARPRPETRACRRGCRYARGRAAPMRLHDNQ